KPGVVDEVGRNVHVEGGSVPGLDDRVRLIVEGADDRDGRVTADRVGDRRRRQIKRLANRGTGRDGKKKRSQPNKRTAHGTAPDGAVWSSRRPRPLSMSDRTDAAIVRSGRHQRIMKIHYFSGGWPRIVVGNLFNPARAGSSQTLANRPGGSGGA